MLHPAIASIASEVRIGVRWIKGWIRACAARISERVGKFMR
jgi:hypothetical protein